MDFSNKLQLAIDEYLNENNKKNIQLISIAIPKHRGYFFIMDSFKLSLKSSETFSLSILFSFNPTNKYGHKLADKVSQTACFRDFVSRKDGRNLMYLKEIGNDKYEIIRNIECIVNGLFPQVATNEIIVDLKRITSWFTIQEEGK